MRTYHLEEWMIIVTGLALRIMANLDKLLDDPGR